MSANIVDVLIFIPLIPAIPVIATWFLPWERWIPKKIPKKIIGPYLLYCAFAIWHFKQPWWFVSMAGLGGIAVSAVAIFELRKARMVKQARDWPVAEGCVLHTSQSRDADGVLKVTLTYTYKVHDERFGGSESFTLIVNLPPLPWPCRCLNQSHFPDKIVVASRFHPQTTGRRGRAA